MSKSNHKNPLSPITMFDVQKLMLGLHTLQQAEQLMGKSVFDVDAYFRLRQSVNNLYNDICKRVPNASQLLQQIKEFVPNLDFDVLESREN